MSSLPPAAAEPDCGPVALPGPQADRQAWLDAVDGLVAEGRAVEAVGALADRIAAQPIDQPDAELEQRLVLLRHEAFLQLPEAPGRSPWPPEVPDRFAGIDGIPEVPVAELTGEVLAAGILHHGALLVRGLVGTRRAAELVAGIDQAMDACHRAQASGDDGDDPHFGRFEPVAPYTVGAARNWVWQAGGLWAVDSPRMLSELIAVFESAGVTDVLTDYLGERPALSVKKCTLRRVPVDTGSDWHQDGAFLGDEIRTVNVWLTLTHCGDEAPGLDLVPERMDRILETGTNGAIFDWSVGQGTVDQVLGPAGIIRPVFEAGDALLFDQRFLHRTAADAAMVNARYAIESWFFAPSHYPHDQVPVYV